MAVYPEGNPGVYPVDMSTQVGVFRALVGDTESTPYDPVEAGVQNYEMFSDVDIEGFIAAGSGNLSRGVGFAYLALAGRAGLTAKSVKDFDLTVDTTKRPAELRLIAQTWFTRADEEEASMQDAFVVAPLGDCGDPLPEGMMPRYGRFSVWGREC